MIPALGHSYEFNKREARYICTTCRGRADKGDVNGDGKVNMADAMKVVAAVRGQSVVTDAMDVNGDGKCNMADMAKIVAIVRGK